MTIIAIITALILLFFTLQFGFFVDVPVFLCAFLLIIKFRNKIAAKFSKIKLSNRQTVVLSSLPFILFEEIINSPLAVLIITVPVLLLSTFLLHLIVKKFNFKNFHVIMIVYSLLGLVFELTIGGSKDVFKTLDVVTFYFMLFWVFISYYFIAVVPLTIQLKNNQFRERQ